MNIYTFLSIGYDFLESFWFSEKGVNPRKVIQRLIPNDNCKVLDMCCGTFTNGLSIAQVNDNNRIYGVDLSKPMLREARRKIKKSGLKNIRLRCADATDTHLAEKQFDYIVIGLILHECLPELREGILKEARRLLKEDGKLIVLEWEQQTKCRKRIKYAPLYVLEVLNCKAFKEFYYCDKADYFKKNGFEMVRTIHCNYSAVMEMRKI